MEPIPVLKKAWYVVTQKMETVLIRTGSDVIEFPVDDLGKNTIWQLSENTSEYAIFSTLVYQDIKDHASIPRGLYPEPILDDILSSWKFVDAASLPLRLPVERSARKQLPGLKVHFWHSEENNELLIVFRGTSSFSDWWANARWISRFVPGIDDHYDVVRLGMQDLVDRIRGHYGVGIKLSVTGHSLGGGLAQQAAYAANGIESVYVFNSSPVTGYYEVKKTIRETNAKGLRIVRIFEHGEVLAYLRLPLRLLYRLSKNDPEIQEMRFNLLKRKNLIEEHSMKDFSRFLYNYTHSESVRQEVEQPELLGENA